MNDCVLGLDSGGSKTLVAVADRQGRVLHRETAAGLDPIANPQWSSQLHALLQAATRLPLSAAVVGLPMHGELTRCSIAQRDTAQRALLCPVLVENDVRIAFDGAFAGQGAGVLILAGTGSMAWASRNQPGAEHVRVGGWGDVFGDEGSAYWIGCQVLTLASRSLDGRAYQPHLTQALLEHLALGPGQLADWAYGLANRRAAIAALAECVSTWAVAGDAAALAVMDEAATHLAAHIDAAWRQLGLSGPATWSYAGGVFAHTPMIDGIRRRIGTAACPPRLSPIGGALWRAAHNAGWNPDQRWIEQLSLNL
ncbi:ATPase [Pseudomonas brassicacearum]|uniref:N-acetylglucosamine kinase n=1 Tax=Pseudomonas brassicacearum TaxID=930166 RepID=UPI000F4615D6|nr:BadF/BadG/BcrA/BcrD ATPase family protein [Pseudomonas brassicacearum]ROM72637.1 ATPase [Pseudomonas brassicacearum]